MSPVLQSHLRSASSMLAGCAALVLVTGCVAPRAANEIEGSAARPTPVIILAESPPILPETVHAFPQTEVATPAPTTQAATTDGQAADMGTAEAPDAAVAIAVSGLVTQSVAATSASTVTTAIVPISVQEPLPFAPTGIPIERGAALPEPTPAPAAESLDGAVTWSFTENVPNFPYSMLDEVLRRTASLSSGGRTVPLQRGDQDAPTLLSAGGPAAGLPVLTQYFAVVVPFDTLQDDISLDELKRRWQSGDSVYTTDTGINLLHALLGSGAATINVVDGNAEMIASLEADRNAIGLIGFESLDPRFKVLTVDDVNLLSNQLAEGDYPLMWQVGVTGPGAGALQALLRSELQGWTNRDPARLTTLVMTGVTAMARGTADAIERSGNYAYPAEIIGPELALADITHVSNEIPFIEGCEVRNFENNLILCSKPEYWAALELMGTDIVGLSGNHVNDFGRDGARESLGWYKENNIPIYGSGLTIDEACAPLLWEHNGNTFAFLAALAYGPEGAWVTESEPGACYYYEHRDRILSTIESLAAEVDVVAVELQYEETYFAYPTPDQVEEFRALRAAGANLVTGVQSHVPQAQEPYGAAEAGGPGMISYGLGNLYFDQMWSWETRSELYARHTIYNGQIISTEILTGVLEDFAQPRWADPSERELILTTIFDGAPDRP